MILYLFECINSDLEGGLFDKYLKRRCKKPKMKMKAARMMIIRRTIGLILLTFDVGFPCGTTCETSKVDFEVA